MKLGIYRTGQLSRELLTLVQEQKSKWNEIFFITEQEPEKDTLLEHSVYSYEKVRNIFSTDEIEILVGSGEPYFRGEKYQCVHEAGYKLATFVHSSSVVAPNVVIGEGTIVFPFCYVTNGVQIGKNALIHTHAIIENNCVIGDYSFISAGAFIGADAKVGIQSFIGPQSSVKDGIVIGNNCMIGIGSNVVKDISDNQVAVGNPAKLIRENDAGIIFTKKDK